MEFYLIAAVILGFVVYMTYSDTNKKFRPRAGKNKPGFGDYLKTFIQLVVKSLEEGKKSKPSKSNVNKYSAKNTFFEKKIRGQHTYYRGIQVLGGLLPHSTYIAGIEVRYDQQRPTNTRAMSGKQVFEAKGNIQVFYAKPEEEQKYIFIAESVDTYRKY